jgi:hypothetical protein
MELDRNAPAFAENKICIQARPTEIWKIITDVNRGRIGTA